MSLGLATKGVLGGLIGGGGGTGDPVPACPPDKTTDEVGALHMDATIQTTSELEVEPGPGPSRLPSTIDNEDILPTLRTLPLPRNL